MPNELIAVYSIFGHTADSSSRFIMICANEALQVLKGKNTASGIHLFLELLFDVGSDDDRIEIGKLFLKLNKQTLDNINEFTTTKFNGRSLCLTKWGEVYGIATKAIPIPKKGGFFFKPKQ
jgi:hypothetical protein